MGLPARPQRSPGDSTPRPRRSTPPVHPVDGTQDTEDFARQIAQSIGRVPRNTHEVQVTAKVRSRMPHDMLGDDGYSLVSNYFARRVLPYCLMNKIITPLQTAVLSNFIGRQDRGLVFATLADIAEEVDVARTSVGGAVTRLCDLNLLRKVKRGVYELNPRVAFNGNGDEQNEFLWRLREQDLEGNFPDELGPEMTLFAVTEAV
jgi:hypothetical protein